MARAVLVLVLIFTVLLLLRALRLFALRWLGRHAVRRRPPPLEQQMARDPICGAWFDRRLAVTGRRSGEPVEVCSEACRRRLEAG